MVKKRCKVCGKFATLSRRGLCWECSVAKMQTAITQIRQKKGKIYEDWAEKLRASLSKSKRG